MSFLDQARPAEDRDDPEHDPLSEVGRDDAQRDHPDDSKRSVAAKLVERAESVYAFGHTDEGDPFGAAKQLPHIAMYLRGGRTGVRADLAARHFDDTGNAPSSQALTDALTVLEGKAARTGRPQRLHLRVAEHPGGVYIDMGRPDGHVIHIADGRWSIVETAPVKFLRTKLTGEMPVPVSGGNPSMLWRHMNVTEADRSVLLAWLVAAWVQEDVPHAILGLFAGQGSAKSTNTRRVIDIIDPSPVPLRQPPRDVSGWATAANSSWGVAVDNLSTIQEWFSDTLCRASTGDGMVNRALYTDSDVAVLKFRRCVILNGIDVGAIRSDLAERLASVSLDRLDGTNRRDENQLEQEWATELPAIVGALLDLAAAVHARLPSTVVDNPPRMADFAKVVAAVDAELGTDGLTRIRDRGLELVADALTDDPLIARLREKGDGFADCTSAELLVFLTEYGVLRPQGWPTKPRQVTSTLHRHAPGLRAMGWTVEHDGGRNKDKSLRWTLTPPSGVSADESAGVAGSTPAKP